MKIKDSIETERELYKRKIKSKWDTVSNLDDKAIIWGKDKTFPDSANEIMEVRIREIPAGYRYAVLPGVGYSYIGKLTQHSKCVYKNIEKLKCEVQDDIQHTRDSFLPRIKSSLFKYLDKKEIWRRDSTIFLENTVLGGKNTPILLVFDADEHLRWDKDENLVADGWVYLPDSIRDLSCMKKMSFRNCVYYGGSFQTVIMDADEIDLDTDNNDEIWNGFLTDVATQGINKFTTLKIIPKL